MKDGVLLPGVHWQAPPTSSPTPGAKGTLVPVPLPPPPSCGHGHALAPQPCWGSGRPHQDLFQDVYKNAWGALPPCGLTLPDPDKDRGSVQSQARAPTESFLDAFSLSCLPSSGLSAHQTHPLDGEGTRAHISGTYRLS
jgi:hypothetical protein